MQIRILGMVLAAVASVAICMGPFTVARAETSAAITSSLSPNRPGAHGALRLTIHFAASGSSAPSPVRRAVLRLPVGLGIEIPHLRSCSIALLRAHGASGCQAQSLLGRGQALVEAQAGSQIITERISLWLFLGPLHNLEPTFEVLAQGYTPFDERIILTGKVSLDSPPFGEDLVLSIPPIPTLPLEPEASIITMSLTVGVSKPHDPRNANTVIVPTACPRGGFPFAADFTYDDGSSVYSLATAPCPK